MRKSPKTGILWKYKRTFVKRKNIRIKKRIARADKNKTFNISVRVPLFILFQTERKSGFVSV